MAKKAHIQNIIAKLLPRQILIDQTGSAVIESAICLGVVFMLIFGYIFFIEAYRTAMVMEHAAMEGARYSAIYNGSVGQEKAEEILSVGAVSKVIGNYPEVTAKDREITVEVETKFRVPFADNVGNFTIRRSAELTKEIDFDFYGKGSETIGYTGNPYR